MGGMPTPPPTSKLRRRPGWGVKPLPIGPMLETRSPARRCDSEARPCPTVL